MRFLIVVAAMLLCSAVTARAELHTFVIANESDGYGVDRCLANGEGCGRRIALTYCQSRNFSQVVAFEKIDRSDVTGSLPAQLASACPGGNCPDLVAITCER
jgi:hypothetical protein